MTLDLGNAGTATRFLAAAALLASAPITIDGNERMRQRPIGELAGVLATLGMEVEYLGGEGCPPLRLTPPARPARPHGTIDLGTTRSSQFLSALLLVGPWLPRGLTLRLRGEVTSESYVAMTVRLLHHLGASVKIADGYRVIRVGAAASPGGGPPGVRPFDYAVEPDASGAANLWAAAAMIPGAGCRVLGLGAGSLQGDAAFPELLARMGATVTRPDSGEAWIEVRGPGALSPILADLSGMPDTAMALAAVAAFAPGASVIRGLRTLRVKETDRIAAMVKELAKIRVRVETPVAGDPHAVTLTPPPGGVDCSPGVPPVRFDTYADHRMAMAMALIGLRRPNVFINDPGCVAKTYPGYWGDLAKFYE